MKVLEPAMDGPPALGDTGKAVWAAWRSQEYMAGTSCFARVILEESLGELVWAIGTTGKELTLCRVVGGIGVEELAPGDQDKVWDALLAGRVQIYRRRNSPSTGAVQVTSVLHQATARRLSSGLSMQ